MQALFKDTMINFKIVPIQEFKIKDTMVIFKFSNKS